MPRQTADTVALILAVTVAVVVVMTTLVLLYVQAVDPSADTAYAADAISRLVSVMVAALVGYLAGRRVNGHT